MLQRVAACCSVWQFVVVCCSGVQCVAVCKKVLSEAIEKRDINLSRKRLIGQDRSVVDKMDVCCKETDELVRDNRV